MAGAVTFSVDEAVAILRRHAKSFFWAAWFLPRKARAPIAQLYAFCRHVDDLSDSTPPQLAQLLALRTQVVLGEWPPTLHFERLGVRRAWLLDLLDGTLSDTEFLQPADERALEYYCYRVAGVVGLMMCPLLGVRNEQAWQHAVDLGTAMQLTNIARDVAEDARLKRVYLPASWGGPVPEQVRSLLAKAEGLYRSGRMGLKYIPWRTRVSIAVAAEVYSDIGRALRAQHYDPFAGRAFVSRGRKIVLSLKALFYCLPINRKEFDDKILHNLTWRASDLELQRGPARARRPPELRL